MMNKRRVLSFCITILILLAISLSVILFEKSLKSSQQPSEPAVRASVPSSTISIAGNVFDVNIADTPQKRDQGLSGASPLNNNEGMLFIFDMPGRYGFWMYKMNYPLDFVWIDGNKVVQLDQNVPAPLNGAPIKTISPAMNVDKVLEVNAGTILSDSIKVGNLVEFNF